MYYTQEQIDRANQADLVSFLQGRGEQLTRAGQEYRWKRHDSLTIRGNKWYRHSQSKGGGPVDFVMEFFSKSFTEAVELLTGEKGAALPPGRPSPRPSPTSGYHPGTPTTEQRGTTSQQPAALMKMCRAFSFPPGIFTRKPPTTTPYSSAEMKAAYRDTPTSAAQPGTSGLM